MPKSSNPLMETQSILLFLVGALAAISACGQVEVTITGSPVFRSIIADRVGALYDLGSRTAVTNDAAAGLITFSGTMSNKVVSLGGMSVKFRLSFSGAVAGLLAVKNGALVVTADTPGTNVSRVPDLTLSEVFPAAARIPASAFDRKVLAVVPFVFARNNAMTGVSNITAEQATLLMSASGSINGANGMPATYLGGVSTNPIYLIGHDAGSGVRISLHEEIGFYGTPILWAADRTGNYVMTNGYLPGQLAGEVIAARSDAIGYMAWADFASISNQAAAISYQGFAYSPENVYTGKYTLWDYEHLMSRAGGLSTNQLAVRDALIDAILDPLYQSASPYKDSFSSLSQMRVERPFSPGPIVVPGPF